MKKYCALLLVFGFHVLAFSQDFNIYFEFDQCSVSEELLSNELTRFGFSDSVLIVGYADTVGNESHNLQLSRERAESVKSYLVANGINPYLLHVDWKGESKVRNLVIDSLNRCVEIYIFTKPDIFPKKTEEQFVIDNSMDTVIYGGEGTFIKIPANSIISPTTAKGDNYLVTLNEYYSTSDIILNSLTTRTNSEILETRGMIHLNILRDGRKCSIDKDNPIQIGFPYPGEEIVSMKLFNGKPNSNGELIWEESEKTEKLIYSVMDEIPQFKGNRYISFSQYLTANIKYPTISRENSVCGRVYVTFVIDETGKVENATILRGLDSSINEEVLRVVNASPIWAPGKKDGQNVAVSYSIPVDFRLEGGECLFLKNNGGEHTGVHSILTDSAFEGSMLEDIDYYMFNTLSLGWINCDFYPFKGKRKVDMRIKLNITRTVSVHLIFTKYNSVLSGTYRNGCFVFDRVPKNEEVVVVGIMKSGNKFLFTSKKLVVSNDIQHLDSFEEITFEDMKEILDGLY